MVFDTRRYRTEVNSEDVYYNIILGEAPAITNEDIAGDLGIPIQVYENIVKKHNGFAPKHFGDNFTFFAKEEDAKKVILELEPYLIMAKLTEEL